MRQIALRAVVTCTFLGCLAFVLLSLFPEWARAATRQTHTLVCPPNALTPAESTIGCGMLVSGGPSIGLAGNASGDCDNTTKCCRWDFTPTCGCGGCENQTCTYGVTIRNSCPFADDIVHNGTVSGSSPGSMVPTGFGSLQARAGCNDRSFVALLCGGDEYYQILRCGCLEQ